MKKLESTITNMVVVLVGVAVIMGCILAWVNHVTIEPIRVQNEKTLADGIKAVMGGGEITVEETTSVTLQDNSGKDMNFVVYQISDATGYIGAAVQSTTSGFGGDLKVLVGFNPDGDILGYTVLAHAETPGLGAKAGDWFQANGKASIIGLNPATANMTVSKDGGDIDAITASTITSRAFLLAITNAYAAYKNDPDGVTGATTQEEAKN